jgi:hypothetical protein
MKKCAHGPPLVGGHDTIVQVRRRNVLNGGKGGNRELIAIESRRMCSCACVAAECRSGIHLWPPVTRMNPSPLHYSTPPSPPLPSRDWEGQAKRRRVVAFDVVQLSKDSSTQAAACAVVANLQQSARQLFQRTRHHARKKNLHLFVP